MFFSKAHGIFSKIPHMIVHKISLNKFKKIEIISRILSNHKGQKLETNSKEKIQKHSNSWRLNIMLLNNEWVNNKIKEKIKKFLESDEMNSQQSKTYRTNTVKAVLRGKFIVIQAYLKKIETFPITILLLHLQDKEEQKQR